MTSAYYKSAQSQYFLLTRNSMETDTASGGGEGWGILDLSPRLCALNRDHAVAFIFGESYLAKHIQLTSGVVEENATIMSPALFSY